MKDIYEMREALIEQRKQLLNDQLDIRKSQELSNISGKILTSVAIQISYAEVREEKPEIRFIDQAKGK